MRRLSLPHLLFAACCLALAACDAGSSEGPYPQAGVNATPSVSESTPPLTDATTDDHAPTEGDVSEIKNYIGQITGVTDSSVVCNKGAQCEAGGYQIKTYPCAGGLFFGSVLKEDGVTLQNGMDPAKATEAGKLNQGQLVCIAAQATSANTTAKMERSYVIAVPPELVPECKDNTLCQQVAYPNKQACAKAAAMPGFTQGCLSGWVDSAALDQYSMGL